MNIESVHMRLKSILKKFDKGEMEKEKFHKNYDKAGRVQEKALKELSKLTKSLKKRKK